MALANRGVARAELGDKGSALSDLRRAKDLAPDKAAQIDSQIARIASAAAGQAVDADVEITGTPGKGLSSRMVGGLGEDAGIAAQPDLPAPEPLPDEEPEPEAGASMLRPRRAVKSSRREAMPVTGTVSDAEEKPAEMDLPPEERPAAPPKRPAAKKPPPEILSGDGDASKGPGEFLFLK